MSANSTGPDPQRIQSMFASIARRYDRANTILSAGVHHRWRKAAVRIADPKPGDRILDCATGTGDLAIAFHKAVGERGVVVGTDFTPEMIELARAKAPAIRYEVADVTQLPYPDASFDVASISFGIRNVGDARKGISELARVVRSGGRVVILEFGQPPNRLVRALYNFYCGRVLPLLGGAITGQHGAYEYLNASASRFPCGEELVAMMRESARFERIEYKRLTFGIAYLYCGVRS
jgi:demethylmenaquinone methyltransferase/2-methoxy-6-polyprenyl-1,4-benzoquinol methylase